MSLEGDDFTVHGFEHLLTLAGRAWGHGYQVIVVNIHATWRFALVTKQELAVTWLGRPNCRPQIPCPPATKLDTFIKLLHIILVMLYLHIKLLFYLMLLHWSWYHWYTCDIALTRETRWLSDYICPMKPFFYDWRKKCMFGFYM